MFKRLLNTSSFGLDISDDSLKYVELMQTKDGIKLGRYGEYKIPEGVIEWGEIKDPRKLREIILSLKKHLKLKSTHVSLPDNDPQNIEERLTFFKSAGIPVKSFESKAEALARSVVKKGDKETYMIVDFDKKHSTIFVVEGGTVMAGFVILSGTASGLRDEVSKNFIYWHTKKNGEKDNTSVKKIIVSGTEPDMAGFAEYLSVNLRHAVDVANVWGNILETERHIPEINFEESLGFASALGLALKSLNIDRTR